MDKAEDFNKMKDFLKKQNCLKNVLIIKSNI